MHPVLVRRVSPQVVFKVRCLVPVPTFHNLDNMVGWLSLPLACQVQLHSLPQLYQVMLFVGNLASLTLDTNHRCGDTLHLTLKG